MLAIWCGFSTYTFGLSTRVLVEHEDVETPGEETIPICDEALTWRQAMGDLRQMRHILNVRVFGRIIWSR